MQYPEIKVKVLDATSNEKWGPTGTQMQEIAQSSFSYEFFPGLSPSNPSLFLCFWSDFYSIVIMETIWERINDDGKNWRHVYKALLLLEYLIRNGSPEVIREAKMKAIEIQTLKDFQYIDEVGKDAGLSVRQKSKHISELLSDDRRIEEEREKVLIIPPPPPQELFPLFSFSQSGI